MKDQISKDYSNGNKDKKKFSKSVMMKKKYKNQQKLGGGGLSLEVFANAKSKDHNYNPSLIKKQREFYKNAKCVNKYKKTLKQQNIVQNRSSVVTNIAEDGDGEASRRMDAKNKKNNKQSLEQVYENKRQEEEKARLEKELLVQAKKEARERSEAQRKATREKMYKKTRSGQPVMKYRIEHLLHSIQNYEN